MRHTQKQSMNPLLTAGHIVVILLLVIMVFQLSQLNMKFDGMDTTAVKVEAQPTEVAPSAPSAPTEAAPTGVSADRVAQLLDASLCHERLAGQVVAPIDSNECGLATDKRTRPVRWANGSNRSSE